MSPHYQIAYGPSSRSRRRPKINEPALLDLAFELVSDDEGPDNRSIPAGYTYLLQFATHDISWMTLPPDRGRISIRGLRNRRNPRFDLDSLYGRGPDVDPNLYLSGQHYHRLAYGANGVGEPDLPRRAGVATPPNSGPEPQYPALVADARNDEHVLIGQLHLAMIRLHNHFLARDRRGGALRAFAEAQRQTRWHYQFVLLEDLLPRLCPDLSVLDKLRRGLAARARPRASRVPPIPLEFAVAALRVGHSMIRPTYTLNDRGDDPATGRKAPANLPIFADMPGAGLNGRLPLPVGWTVQWDRFVEYQGSDPQPAKCFDTKLAPSLRSLPMPNHVARKFRNLAYLDLLRGAVLGLPDGHTVANALGVEVVAENRSLWHYFLREAEEVGATTLGPAAATIVASAFYDLMWADPESYLHGDPAFAHDLRAKKFDLAALLALSGSPMTAADLPPLPPGV